MSQGALGKSTEETGSTEGSVQKRRGLSGSTLKLIAIVTMFIDHVGAAVLARLLVTHHRLQEFITWQKLFDYFPWIADWDRLYAVYSGMRSIGRIAFPIYCFLLVEGFQRTRSVKKYLLRLGVFALISEVPFDLAFHATVCDMSGQNVFFTLLIGLATVTCFDWVMRKKVAGIPVLNVGIRFVLVTLCVGTGAYIADLLHTDYGARGIFCIMVLCLFRRNRLLQAVAGAFSFYWEVPAPLAFVPIAAYNGRRGLKLKYVFYLFYPLHLLLLYLVCVWLGVGNIAAF